MKKKYIKLLSLMMAFVLMFTMQVPVYADAVEGEGDDVVIDEDDKPYLSLGNDLKDSERSTVLKLMGIDEKNLDEYSVSYVTNDEEHKYLDSYISSKEIGTRALSSIVIVEGEEGDGINISTYNINYCTVGMYKNALATAGITDADIIVAGPFSISGTAALVGIFKAYEEMTGNEVEEEIVDAALDELVTTGELNNTINADSEDVEAMIADLKSQLSGLDSEEEIKEAIDETAKKYEISLTDDEKAKIVTLLTKLKNLDLDWDSIGDQASKWAEKLGDVDAEGIWESIKSFFADIYDAIVSLFN